MLESYDRTTLASQLEAKTKLSPRQHEVLRRIARGEDSPEIAKGMYLSGSTVKTHIQEVMRRLGARNRAHAVALGYERGLLKNGDAGERR